jgi:hypothetical protein
VAGLFGWDISGSGDEMRTTTLSYLIEIEAQLLKGTLIFSNKRLLELHVAQK